MRFLTTIVLVVCLALCLGIVAGRLLGEPPRFASFPPRSGEADVLILRVIDGDTIEIGYIVPESCRVYGINARERTEPGGPDATKALIAMVRPGTVRRAHLKGLDKYGRALADFETDNKKLVSVEMIGAGHAKPWDGQGKKP